VLSGVPSGRVHVRCEGQRRASLLASLGRRAPPALSFTEVEPPAAAAAGIESGDTLLSVGAASAVGRRAPGNRRGAQAHAHRRAVTLILGGGPAP
jgi:hypothetical protein